MNTIIEEKIFLKRYEKRYPEIFSSLTQFVVTIVRVNLQNEKILILGSINFYRSLVAG